MAILAADCPIFGHAHGHRHRIAPARGRGGREGEFEVGNHDHVPVVQVGLFDAMAVDGRSVRAAEIPDPESPRFAADHRVFTRHLRGFDLKIAVVVAPNGERKRLQECVFRIPVFCDLLESGYDDCRIADYLGSHSIDLPMKTASQGGRAANQDNLPLGRSRLSLLVTISLFARISRIRIVLVRAHWKQEGKKGTPAWKYSILSDDRPKGTRIARFRAPRARL